MQDIITSIWDTLFWIITGVPVAIKNELLSSSKPRTIEEQIVDKSHRQSSMIQSQQDSLVYHVRVNRDLRSENYELKALLEQRDKTIKALEAKVRSLEIENF